MTDTTPPPAGDADRQAARVLLSRLGVSVQDLLADQPQRPAAPTFAEYVPVVAAAVSPGTRRVYGSYWDRVLAQWAHRRIDEPSPSEVKGLCEHVRTHVVGRRNARGGRGAAEHLVAALRFLYRQAINDGWLTEAQDPSRKVAKPRRLPSTRRALPDAGLAEVNRIAASTGNDPGLDALLLRLHTETACRRGGALALRPGDLDAEQCLILLREKGETVRWQPVSPTLMRHLQCHIAERHHPAAHDPGIPGTSSQHGGKHGAGNQHRGDVPLLRYRDGRALSKRRYDHLWKRIGTHLPWVATQQISTHWLRHTTLTWVERNYGYAVARAYAGHTERNDAGTTTTYVRASLQEVATALAGLTGEPHPMQTPTVH
jgi:integrase